MKIIKSDGEMQEFQQNFDDQQKDHNEDETIIVVDIVPSQFQLRSSDSPPHSPSSSSRHSPSPGSLPKTPEKGNTTIVKTDRIEDPFLLFHCTDVLDCFECYFLSQDKSAFKVLTLTFYFSLPLFQFIELSLTKSNIFKRVKFGKRTSKSFETLFIFFEKFIFYNRRKQ